MEATNQQRIIDVTGLPEEAIAAVESLVAVIRAKDSGKESLSFPSREEWSKSLRAWAASHRSLEYAADDSRESIYEGRGE